MSVETLFRPFKLKSLTLSCYTETSTNDLKSLCVPFGHSNDLVGNQSSS